MNNNQEIHKIACQLASENKNPSVALIKSRLINKVPLANIIKGLQYWQSNPKPLEITTAEEQPEAAKTSLVTQEQMQLAIKNAISPLIEEIALLKKSLNN